MKRWHTTSLTKVPLVQCACGCGTTMAATNKWGYKRKFIKGHHSRKRDGQHQEMRVQVHLTPADYMRLRTDAADRGVPMARLLVESWEAHREGTVA